MARKHNSKGRSRTEGRFLAVPHFMLETQAWRSLDPYSRAAWLEVAQLYDGRNNGFLDMAVRRLAQRMGVGKNVAHRSLTTLIERGLIEPAEVSGFSRKDRKSTSYRLTHRRCDRTHQLGSRAYQAWRPALDEMNSTVPHGDLNGALAGDREAATVPSVGKIEANSPSLATVSGPCGRDTSIFTMGGTPVEQYSLFPSVDLGTASSARVGRHHPAAWAS